MDWHYHGPPFPFIRSAISLERDQASRQHGFSMQCNCRPWQAGESIILHCAAHQTLIATISSPICPWLNTANTSRGCKNKPKVVLDIWILNIPRTVCRFPLRDVRLHIAPNTPAGSSSPEHCMMRTNDDIPRRRSSLHNWLNVSPGLTLIRTSKFSKVKS